MKLSTYLSLSRHGVFYFRWPLPCTEVGKRPTIKISLRTRCPERAGILSRYLASCGQSTKDNEALARLRQDKIRELVREYFKSQLAQYLSWMDKRGLSRKALAEAESEMLDHQSYLDMDLPSELYLPIERFKRKMRVSDADWFDSLPNAQIELRKGRRDMLAQVLQAAQSAEHYSFGTNPTALPREAPQHAPEELGAPLGDAVAAYLDNSARETKQGTTEQYRAYLNVLVEHFGAEMKLGGISKRDAAEFKEVVMAIPRNRNKKKELQGLSLHDAIKVQGLEKLSARTVNSYLSCFHNFSKWSVAHGYASEVLFEGMSVSKKKSKQQYRKPFSQERLRTIYCALTDTTTKQCPTESHRWGALLGLFTGARLNEVCQLQTSDIQQAKDGSWYIHITDEGDDTKSIKTAAGRRKVPVHSHLIELGFLDYVGTQTDRQRLLPDFNLNKKGGYGRALGRWFNETFLVRLEIKDKTRVFHSLRHSLVTELARSDVSDPIIQCIVGHERSGVTQSVYLREGYSVSQLSRAIELYQPHKTL
ncbi:site-specific integrase [Thalassovita autumnalis]|uniref:site-specific integrase n=1 Tax=Thalassovita autumnalis TaxID=2072972 RepID=UPI00071D9C9B|nr:site-specific integrase [Thalassovita autumnalis]